MSFSPVSSSISSAFGWTFGPSILTSSSGAAGVGSSSAVAVSLGVGVGEIDGVADEVGSVVGSLVGSLLEHAARTVVAATSAAKVFVERTSVDIADLLDRDGAGHAYGRRSAAYVRMKS
ncbi:hypothetical protein [Nocardioides furvisabuli]|uniref:hypothetical protein n=1 Tax=Nocardioides furvisabuli TaxID=375542 RepID=UPI001E36EF2C|nr:hypothetical protein [Nocardioides furvisabuli]